MMALTICEPWAWAIVDLSLISPTPKNVENRGPTFPDYTGPLLIHSGKGDRYKRTYRGAVEWITARAGVAGLGVPSWEDLAGRGLIGWAEEVETLDRAMLRHITTGGNAAHRWNYDFESAKRWAEGPKCLLLAGVVPFVQPIPCRGQQGLFRVQDEVVCDAIEAARERAAIREYGGG